MKYILNNKTVLIIIIVLSLILICCFIPKGDNNTITEENKETLDNLGVLNSDEKLEEYYKDDKIINKYINLFNNLYSNNKITSDMISPYYHNGRYHKEQVKFFMNSIEVTLTSDIYNNKISIFIDNVKNSININNSSDEEVIELAVLFSRVLKQSLSEEEFEEYFNDQKESNSSISEYYGIEYQTSKNINTNIFEYIKISSKLDNTL